ncbi:MAG: PaaI family thioesterase [Chloroflexi bacterium]|nr:PaaI family thioesterase [Chloroflexota bacterium]MQC26961.1 PaaI family thioesterase [Chloroflexota bacterium]
MNKAHKLPNSARCFACGVENQHGLQLEFYADGEGGAVCDYVVPDEFESYPGIVNGGIVAAMLDEMAIRAFLVEDPNRLMYTAKLTTRYRKHVPTQQPLRLTSRATKDRGRRAEAIAQLFGPDGDLLAEAEALMVELDPGELDEMNLEGLGWRVYPEDELPA